MPLYDYAPKSGKCRICKGRFEAMQRITAPKLKRCPACGKPVERLITKVALGGPETIVRKKGPQQTDLNRPIRTVSDPSD